MKERDAQEIGGDDKIHFELRVSKEEFELGRQEFVKEISEFLSLPQ